MTFPLSHKTVFLLDQSFAFAQPCEEIEIESIKSTVSQQAGFPPLPPISKTIWTSAIESVLEYCRIVWDIFPAACEDVNESRLIRLIIFNDKETKTVFPSWDRKFQSSASLSNEMALAGRPELTSNKFGSAAKAKEKMRNGLRQALEVLCEETEAQAKLKKEDKSSALINRGRIVCFTQTEDIQAFTEEFSVLLQKELSEINSAAAGSVLLSSIAQLDVNVISVGSTSTHSFNAVSKGEEITQQLSPSISYNICRSVAGHLHVILLEMALSHFELASTTVTNIPMKEEQNASSSASYNVELFHKASAHLRLLADSHVKEDTKAVRIEDLATWMPQTQKEGFRYNTVELKWCTPRGSSADLHNCIALARVSPTDVNSRHSSCLTNFLLSGRSVMLEMPQRSGKKILSHMLTSHGGEIFIHTLNISRSILEDPPSISEGPGGRVTDYRIPDYGTLMKENRMAPYYGNVKAQEGQQPIEKMRDRVARYTKSCPMIISATTIFNMEALEPLQKILVQEELSEDNLAECRKIIFSLHSMEHRGELLPVPMTTSASGGKGKTMKKDEQYRLMFSELEKYLTAHCRTENHVRVLNCLLESRNKPQASSARLLSTAAAATKKDEKAEFDIASKEWENYNKMTEREKADFNRNDDTKRNRSPSPGPPNAKRVKQQARASSPATNSCGSGNNESLFDILTKKNRAKARNYFSIPFVGMRSVGEKARLYLSLDRKSAEKEHGFGNAGGGEN